MERGGWCRVRTTPSDGARGGAEETTAVGPGPMTILRRSMVAAAGLSRRSSATYSARSLRAPWEPAVRRSATASAGSQPRNLPNSARSLRTPPAFARRGRLRSGPVTRDTRPGHGPSHPPSPNALHSSWSRSSKRSMDPGCGPAGTIAGMPAPAGLLDPPWWAQPQVAGPRQSCPSTSWPLLSRIRPPGSPA